MNEPSVNLSGAWSQTAPLSLVPRSRSAWRRHLSCGLLVLLLHAGLLYLLLPEAAHTEAQFKPQVIAVRWQAAPAPQTSPAVAPAPAQPVKPVTKPVVKPVVKPKPILAAKPVAVRTPVSRPAPHRERKPERKAVQPTPAAAVARAAPTQELKAAAAPLPVVAPRYQAPGLNNPALRYPPMSRRLGEEGRVRLRVLVSPAGQALKVELLASSGFPRLDAAARELVASWHFLPASRGGSAVQGWVDIPIVFQLRSR